MLTTEFFNIIKAVTISKPTLITVPTAGSDPGQAGLNELITRLVGTALVITGIFFLFMLVIGGLRWTTAGGDKANLESAKGKITDALIGLIIVVAAFVLSEITFNVVGLKGVKIQ